MRMFIKGSQRTPGLAGTMVASPRSPEIDRCDLFQIAGFKVQTSGTCSYDAGQTCVVQLRIMADAANSTGDVSYSWTSSVNGTATVAEINGSELLVYEIWITADTETIVSLTCIATDDTGNTPLYDGDVITLHQLNV